MIPILDNVAFVEEGFTVKLLCLLFNALFKSVWFESVPAILPQEISSSIFPEPNRLVLLIVFFFLPETLSKEDVKKNIELMKQSKVSQLVISSYYCRKD